MRLNALLWLLQYEAIPLVLIVGALLVILRVIRPGTLLLTVLGLALTPLLGPIFDLAFGLMPWWMVLLVLAAISMSFLRGMAALLIGPRAADHMVGTLAAGFVSGVLRGLFMLPIIVLRAARAVTRGL